VTCLGQKTVRRTNSDLKQLRNNILVARLHSTNASERLRRGVGEALNDENKSIVSCTYGVALLYYANMLDRLMTTDIWSCSSD
jgi:hypothetical protein